MKTTKEAAGRIVITEFEARRSRDAAAWRLRRWRIVSTLLYVAVCIGGAVYLSVSGVQISGAQACASLLIGAAGLAWPAHQSAERLRMLEEEVRRLRDKLVEKSV